MSWVAEPDSSERSRESLDGLGLIGVIVCAKIIVADTPDQRIFRQGVVMVELVDLSLLIMLEIPECVA